MPGTASDCGCNDNNICEYHADRDKLIAKISNMVNAQAGQWRMLLIGITLFGGVMGILVTMQYNIQHEMAKTVNSLVAESAVGKSERAQTQRNIERMLSITQATLLDHRHRLREIENDH